MRLRVLILAFSLSCFALVLVVLLQLAGPVPTPLTRRLDAGLTWAVDRQAIEVTHTSRADSAAPSLSYGLNSVAGEVAGFQLRVSRLVSGYRQIGVARSLRIPLWALDAVLVGLVLRTFVAVRRTASREFARRRGRCPACGYDLRATPRRCPECGSVTVDLRPQ